MKELLTTTELIGNALIMTQIKDAAIGALRNPFPADQTAHLGDMTQQGDRSRIGRAARDAEPR